MPRFDSKFLRLAIYWIARLVLWSGDDRPGRMQRFDREEDVEFAAQERLYFRCRCDWLTEEGWFKPASIPFPDQSVNRSKYSRPWDVLIPDHVVHGTELIFWGIGFVHVADVPEPIKPEGSSVVHTFMVEHDPLENNFGHSELRVYKNGLRETKGSKINDKVKKKYRQIVSERAQLHLRALI